jgi:hypothetical protein
MDQSNMQGLPDQSSINLTVDQQFMGNESI